jgi:hypothetical protein
VSGLWIAPRGARSDRLRTLAREVPGPLVLTTSFGLEDQALTHFVATAGIEAVIITLEPGNRTSDIGRSLVQNGRSPLIVTREPDRTFGK